MKYKNLLSINDACFEYVDKVEPRYGKTEYLMAFPVSHRIYQNDRSKTYQILEKLSGNIRKGKNIEENTMKLDAKINEFNSNLIAFMIKLGIRKSLLGDIHIEDLNLIHKKITEDILLNFGITDDETAKATLMRYLDVISNRVIERKMFNMYIGEQRIQFLHYIIGYTINRYATTFRIWDTEIKLYDYEPIDKTLEPIETVKLIRLKIKQRKDIIMKYSKIYGNLTMASSSTKEVLMLIHSKCDEIEKLEEPIIHIPGFENGITNSTKQSFIDTVLENFGFGTEQCKYKKKPYAIRGILRCDDLLFDFPVILDNWIRRNGD